MKKKCIIILLHSMLYLYIKYYLIFALSKQKNYQEIYFITYCARFVDYKNVNNDSQ